MQTLHSIIPGIIAPCLYPGIITRNKNKGILLTFDDGPTPDVTEKVLDILNKFNIKALFFCLGKNVDAFPNLFQKIIDQGHAIGNHGYSHYNGWKTNNKVYFNNISGIKSKIYRPPYGKITPRQFRYLKKENHIALWSLISYDYDLSKTIEQNFQHLINNTRTGEIVVFHDSVKAYPKVVILLEKYIDYCLKNNFSFVNANEFVNALK